MLRQPPGNSQSVTDVQSNIQALGNIGFNSG